MEEGKNQMIDVKGKRIFLSGPMSMVPNYNVAAFAEAHARLKLKGAAEVYNPAITFLMKSPKALDAYTHGDWLLDTLHALTRRGNSEHMAPFNEAMPRTYDMVVLLPGWEESEGATAEAMVAKACSIACHELEEVLA